MREKKHALMHSEKCLQFFHQLLLRFQEWLFRPVAGSGCLLKKVDLFLSGYPCLNQICVLSLLKESFKGAGNCSRGFWLHSRNSAGFLRRLPPVFMSVQIIFYQLCRRISLYTPGSAAGCLWPFTSMLLHSSSNFLVCSSIWETSFAVGQSSLTAHCPLWYHGNLRTVVVYPFSVKK